MRPPRKYPSCGRFLIQLSLALNILVLACLLLLFNPLLGYHYIPQSLGWQALAGQEPIARGEQGGWEMMGSPADINEEGCGMCVMNEELCKEIG